MVQVRCDGKRGPKEKVLKEITPRSYEVFTEYCNTLRRKRRDLLKIQKTEFSVDDGSNSVASKEYCDERDVGQKSTPKKSFADSTLSSSLNAEKAVRPRRFIVKPKRLTEEC